MFRELLKIDLPSGDFAIFGSGPLLIRGIIPTANDLDVLCRGDAWEQVKLVGNVEYLDDYDVDVVTLINGRLTFGTRWGIGQFDIDRLIDEAEIIDGLPFVRLEHVISYKRIRGSQKDLQHLRALGKSDQ